MYVAWPPSSSLHRFIPPSPTAKSLVPPAYRPSTVRRCIPAKRPAHARQSTHPDSTAPVQPSSTIATSETPGPGRAPPPRDRQRGDRRTNNFHFRPCPSHSFSEYHPHIVPTTRPSEKQDRYIPQIPNGAIVALILILILVPPCTSRNHLTHNKDLHLILFHVAAPFRPLALACRNCTSRCRHITNYPKCGNTILQGNHY